MGGQKGTKPSERTEDNKRNSLGDAKRSHVTSAETPGPDVLT